GVAPGPALTVTRRDTAWTAEPALRATIRLDGQPLTGTRDLRPGDVLSVGDAQVVVGALTRASLSVEVHHPFGNATITPPVLSPAQTPDGDTEVEIHAVAVSAPETGAPRDDTLRAKWAALRWTNPAIRRRLYSAVAIGAVIALGFLASTFQPVTLDVQPPDARVRSTDTWLALHTGNEFYLRPGLHTLRAE